MERPEFILILSALAVASGQYLDPHCNGKQVIVHLFEWKWSDVAAECERFLGPWGFCGVQISPPHEHVVKTSPPAPWWQRYQPVSYKLVSRSGNEQEFADMVSRCNAVGVRIFADVVVNHMAGSAETGQGSGGTSFDAPSLSFPGVPYSAPNFNARSKCPSHDGGVNNYGDPNNVRNCFLVGLTDLDQSQDYVRRKIVDYFNHMLDLGVAGFRVDASKHMWPQDLAAIQGATKDTQFGGKPFFMQEVIDQNDGAIKVNEYYNLGRVTEFRYCQKITEGVHDFGRLGSVVDFGWGMADNEHALVFVDNHDNQRGHGGGGRILTHEQPGDYKLATAFTLAWNYGFTRVMSSYNFQNSDEGPPHNADYSTANVAINADGSCGGGWVCEHRWPSIRGMAHFRNAVAGTDVSNYYNQGDVVAFSRGNKGFFAMGKRGFDQTFQTGLPAGQYCDLISNCAQKITVDGSGNAHVRPYDNSDPVVAIIVGGPSGPIEEGAVGSAQTGSGNTQTGTGSTTQPDTGTTQTAAGGAPDTGSTLQPSTAGDSSCETAWSSTAEGASDLVTRGAFTDPHCGGRQAIVHLFEWKWTDVAAECERYLGPKGFCGVQVSPAAEHAIVTEGVPQPWWQRYQPVSYKLVSRSGNEQEFADMVSRCNAVGVRIYVDVILNHMSGTERAGTGSGGSHYDGGTLDYPAVPYTAANFNGRNKCPSGSGSIQNYGNEQEVRNCYLLTLADLDQSQDYVRQKMADFLNHLTALGVAGFRVDAAKHMYPQDMAAIEALLDDTQFGGKPFFAHEVIDMGGEPIKVTEYTDLGYVTEFRYGGAIRQGIQNFGTLQNVGAAGMLDSGHALVFVDNHDNQRGHGAGGDMLTFRNPENYKLAQAFTLAWNYGFPRIMSSYEFSNPDEGPPHQADYSTADVTIQPDGTCSGGWVCEHRWPAIGNMVAFRNHVAGTDVSHFFQQGDVVAFARGTKGFFAMGKHGFDQTFQTGLPAGEYCDLISNCAQKITVDASGSAHLSPYAAENPIVAFVVDGPVTSCGSGASGTSGTGSGTSGTGSGTGGTGSGTGGGGPSPQPTVDYGSDAWRRTVILVEKQTSPGQDLFIRGGIDHSHRSGCTNDASSSACAIPIRHRDTGSGDHYAKVNAWSKGDNYLDWYGAESGQGSYSGQRADGTPAVWTTSDASHPGHSQFNTFGQHYWMVDVDMDCSKTESGFFEFKAIVNGGWEGDITQRTCTGPGAGAVPYAANNHVARCGYLNIYHFATGDCDIRSLS